MSGPTRVRVQSTDMLGKTTIVTDLDTGQQVRNWVAADIHVAADEVITARVDMVIEEVDVEAEVVPRDAATIADYVIARLDVQPGEVIFVIPDPNVIADEKGVRYLQEGLERIFERMDTRFDVLVLPPGTRLASAVPPT